MLDWLRRPPRALPTLTIGGQTLPVVVRRLNHARRLTLRLSRDGSEIRLSIPRWAREEEALAFALSRADWLASQLAKIGTATVNHGNNVPYRGIPHRLQHDPTAPRRVLASDGAFLIGGAEDSMAPRLQRWLHGEARRLMAADLEHYCARAGVLLAPLALSSAQARWGSCSARGQVRLNWRLVMAPDSIRRSVVAHEVAHLLHFNHSPAFYALLGTLFEGDVEEANRWLKQHGRSLYAYFG